MSGFHNNLKLKTLDLSNNCIAEVSCISHLCHLSTINLSSNRILDLSPLSSNSSLQVIDLSNNKIESINFETLNSLTNLRCLYLTGNPCVDTTPHYRRQLVTCIPSLQYLDTQAVTETERRLAQAFLRGGEPTEEQERIHINKESTEKTQRQFAQYDEFMTSDRLQPDPQLSQLQTRQRKFYSYEDDSVVRT